jgi:hypothetical protein
MVHDDDGGIHVGRQMLQEAHVGVKTAGRPANADDRKIWWRFPIRPMSQSNAFANDGTRRDV